MGKRGIQAYANTARSAEVGKEADAAVLERMAAIIADLKNNPNDEAWDDVLKYNRMIWTVIQAEMTNPENTLPKEIKANLLSLSFFVDKRTNELLFDSKDPTKLNILININRNIALGLRGDPGPGGINGELNN